MPFVYLAWVDSPPGAAGEDCPVLLGWVLGGCRGACYTPRGSFCAICNGIVCSSLRVGVGSTFRGSHSGGRREGLVGAKLLSSHWHLPHGIALEQITTCLKHVPLHIGGLVGQGWLASTVHVQPSLQGKPRGLSRLTLAIASVFPHWEATSHSLARIRGTTQTRKTRTTHRSTMPTHRSTIGTCPAPSPHRTLILHHLFWKS